MELSKALYFKDRREWQSWLEQYHDKESEAWLIYYKKNSGKTGISYNDALDEALCFGWIDGGMRSIQLQDFTITSIILNLLTALNAWGWLAGIMTISPCLSCTGFPDMVTSASPSKR